MSAQPVLEYARQILRGMGLPLAGNHELIADCIQSIAKAKALDFPKASEYLTHAIRLAREQGIVIDRFFFVDGKYMDVRPVKPSGVPWYQGESLEERAAFEAHKQTEGYRAAQQELEQAWAKLAGRKAMS